MKDFRNITWEDLNQRKHIAPLVGLNLVWVRQAEKWLDVGKRDFDSARAKYKKELVRLGMSVMTGKELAKKTNAAIKTIVERNIMEICSEDGVCHEIQRGKITYFTAPALAFMADQLGVMGIAEEEDGVSQDLCVQNLENDLEIRNVSFMGDELIAVRDADGQIWAGVRWLCDGIGMSEGQRKRQIANIQDDRVLSKGWRKLILPTNGGPQEVFCLKLNYVPLWLAKIAITPMMEAEMPELTEKLVNYQLKAKDVLAAAFLPGAKATPQFEIPQTFSDALRMAADFYDENRMLNGKISRLEESNSSLRAENHLLAKQELTWEDKSLVVALVRKYGANVYSGLDDNIKFGSGFRDFYEELLYRKHINLNSRRNGKKRLDRIKESEWLDAKAVAIAMCVENDIDISEILKRDRDRKSDRLDVSV